MCERGGVIVFVSMGVVDCGQNKTQGGVMLPFVVLAVGMAVEAYFLPLLAVAQVLFFAAFHMIRSSG